MKIYINNNNINNYNSNALNKIEEYFIKKDIVIKIYSELGIFKFNKNRFYKLSPFDKNIEFDIKKRSLKFALYKLCIYKILALLIF